MLSCSLQNSLYHVQLEIVKELRAAEYVPAASLLGVDGDILCSFLHLTSFSKSPSHESRPARLYLQFCLFSFFSIFPLSDVYQPLVETHLSAVTYKSDASVQHLGQL